MTPATVLYHDRCPDGFAAALAARMVHGEAARCIGARHGDALPEIHGGTVYVLDFAYPLEAMQAIVHQAERLVWLDHHASVLDTAAALRAWLGHEELSPPGPGCAQPAPPWGEKTHSGRPSVFLESERAKIVLDMDRSGATLAWNHFFPGQPVPRLIRHVEDRDLWRWHLPETPGYTSALDDLPFDFELWRELLERHEADGGAYAEFVRIGQIGQNKYLKLCEQIAEKAEPIVIDGIAGLQVNASGEFASQVGNLLAARSGTFALIWYVKEGMMRLSFRGTADFNVIPLAQKYGGGGHRAAAGARVPLARLAEVLGQTG